MHLIRNGSLALLLFSIVGPASWSLATERPNVVFLLADDLGYGDLSCYGRTDIKTPNLDRLAQQGVRFTRHYANGAECTPTRTAFLTGRYQQRVGGLECAIGTGNVGRYDDAIRLRETNDLGLPTSQQTIVRLLKDSGYETAIFGKWHLGYEPKFAPHLHGFDHTLYCIGGGMDYFHYLDNVAGYNLFRDGNPVRREGYFTDLITDKALSFLSSRQADAEPFFLYLPFTCPHSPFQAAYDSSDQPLALDSPLWSQGKAPPKVYIDMIQHMDRRIGDVLQRLEELGLSENTLVIFASDNGGTASARNAPLSGIKGSTYEGGIRVPAIARWPGVIPAAYESSQTCLTFDFTAAIAAAANVQPREDQPWDGMDIIKHVSSREPNISRQLYWRKPRGKTTWKATMMGDLKYVAKQVGDQQQEYLFNLATDVAEKRDLKRQMPQQFQRLRTDYLRWETEVRAQRRGQPTDLQP